MKPRSIISLIIAAVFVLAGIITCVVADGMAKADGVMLFPEKDKNGNLCYEMKLEGVKKLNISTTDADVSVFTDKDTDISFIRILNFNANYYKLSKSGGTLSFVQVEDFLSMFNFLDNGFSFKGMRYVLRFGDDSDLKKQVEIHLAPGDSVSGLNLSTETGTLSLSGCELDMADVLLRLDGGNAAVSSCTGLSSFSLSGNTESDATNTAVLSGISAEKFNVRSSSLECELSDIRCDRAEIEMSGGHCSISALTAEELSATVGDGDVSIDPYSCVDGKIKTVGGDVTLLFESDSFTSIVSTQSGVISINGVPHTQNNSPATGFTKNTPDAAVRAEITTVTGDVSLSYPVAGAN